MNGGWGLGRAYLAVSYNDAVVAADEREGFGPPAAAVASAVATISAATPSTAVAAPQQPQQFPISYFINTIIESIERCGIKHHKNQFQILGHPENILINIWVQLRMS